MARIPLGNFGQSVPQVGQTPTAGQGFGQATAEAVQRLGNTADQVFGQLQRQAEARAQQVETIKTQGAVNNGLADLFDSVQADVTSRKLDTLGALAAWKDGSQKVIADGTAGVTGEVAPLVQAHAEALRGQLQNRLFDTFRAQEKQDTNALIGQTTEQLQRFGQTDPGSAIKQHGALLDTQGPTAGLDANQIAKAKQSFAEGVVYNQFYRAGTAAYQSGSVDALDAVQHRLASPEADMLDPQKRAVLQQQIFGFRTQLQSRQDAAQARIDRQAEKQFRQATAALTKAEGVVLGGGMLDAGTIQSLTTLASGTGLEAQVQSLLADQQGVARFAAQPAPQRAATIEEALAGRADPARGISPAGQKQLDMMQRIDSNLREKVRDGNAWAAYAQAGNPAPAAVQLSNPTEAVQVLQDRMRLIDDVETWAGQRVSPLQPLEAEAFGKMLRALPPDQAATLLGQAGALIGDADRVGALGRQIKDKDGVLGMAMLYANSGTTTGRLTAELVLRGDQAIRDKVIKVDGAQVTGWRSDIAKQVRGAYSNAELEQNVVDAAFRIAAATDGDVKRAVRLASGGIVEHNGAKIPLPYGMAEGDFDKRLAAVTPANLESQAPGGFVVVGSTRLPLADFTASLPSARLVHAGQGLYNVQAGGGLVTNEAGKRITIRISP